MHHKVKLTAHLLIYLFARPHVTGKRALIHWQAKACMSHPNVAAPLGPAVAGQSSAWLVCQTGPGAGLRCEGRSPQDSKQAPWGRGKKVGQREAGGVRHPRTCAGSGQECPEPGSAAATEGTQYSDLHCRQPTAVSNVGYTAGILVCVPCAELNTQMYDAVHELPSRGKHYTGNSRAGCSANGSTLYVCGCYQAWNIAWALPW